MFSPLSVSSKLSQNDEFLSVLAELYEQGIQHNYVIDMASMLRFSHTKRRHKSHIYGVTGPVHTGVP